MTRATEKPTLGPGPRRPPLPPALLTECLGHENRALCLSRLEEGFETAFLLAFAVAEQTAGTGGIR